MKYIDNEGLLALAKDLGKSTYADYLRSLLDGSGSAL
jgi:hypothetical protein